MNDAFGAGSKTRLVQHERELATVVRSMLGRDLRGGVDVHANRVS